MVQLLDPWLTLSLCLSLLVVCQRSGFLLRIWRGQVATGIDRYQGEAAGKILILAGVLNMLTTCYTCYATTYRYEKNSEFMWLVHMHSTLHAFLFLLASGV